MKFLVIVALAVVAVAAVSANEHKQQKFHGMAFGQKQQKEFEARHNQQDLESHSKIEQSQVREALDDDEMMSSFDKAKRSYGGGAKCGKAVVVGCSPIVQKVKCKGGYKGAYTENVPQYAYPEGQEYEAGPYIQYV